METVTQRRFRNFLRLLVEFQAKTPELPIRGQLKRFADYSGMNERYLSLIKNGRKQIGHSTARRLENVMAKPVGWLDSYTTEQDMDETLFLAKAQEIFRNDPYLATLWVLQHNTKLSR